MHSNSTYYALFFALWQLSCGSLAPHPSEPLPAVVIATQEQIDTLQVVANRYIVLFKSLPGLEQASFVGYRAETVYFSPFLNEMYHYDAGIKDIRLISAVELPALQDNALIPPNMLSWQQASHAPTAIITEVRFASNELAAAHLQRWHEQGDIYFAEPVYVSLVKQTPDEAPAETLTGYGGLHARYNGYQTDASGYFWWHEEIKLADALSNIVQNSEKYQSWSEVTKTKTIIAVFDSGVDYEHPALQDKMFSFSNYGMTKPDLACGNDINGCNTTNPEKGELGDGRSRPWGTNQSGIKVWGGTKEGGACPSGDAVGFASCSHGTHVAGIIAADGKVGAGAASGGCETAGVCPFCRILNIRVLAGVGADGPEQSRVGGVTDTSILNGLKYVYELWSKQVEVRIINASIGKFHRSRAVALLIKNLKTRSSADGGRGVLVVGAAGNEDTMARTYPAALDDVLAVSATGASGRKSKFSNFGMWVDIAAPGGSNMQKICSTVPGKGYRTEAGTSMAAPVVAGVAGLMVAVSKQKLSAREIEDRLLFSSNPRKLYPDEERDKDLFKDNQNSTHYLAKLDHTEHPVPLLGFGLLDAEGAVSGKVVNLAKEIINNDPVDRVDIASCGTINTPASPYPSAFLLLLPLLLMLRHRCRSSCT